MTTPSHIAGLVDWIRDPKVAHGYNDAKREEIAEALTLLMEERRQLANEVEDLRGYINAVKRAFRLLPQPPEDSR